MTNREYGQIVQGPMTSDGPSVDDLRAQMHGGQVASEFAYREPQGVQVASVTQGEEVRQGDGTMTDADAAQIRRTAGIGQDNRHAADVAKSYSERRDPLTGHALRTYDDGRTEDMDADEAKPRRRQPIQTPKVWYGTGQDDPAA